MSIVRWSRQIHDILGGFVFTYMSASITEETSLWMMKKISFEVGNYIYIYMYMWQMSSVFSHESAQRNDAGHLID